MAKQREKKFLKKWIREVRDGGFLAYRMEDLSYASGMSNKRPFDFYLFKEGRFFPGEAKFQDGGKTFSVKRWKEGKQQHQYYNLLKYGMHGAFSFLIIFWKERSNYVSARVAPVHVFMDAEKLVLADLPVADSERAFMEAIMNNVIPSSGYPSEGRSSLVSPKLDDGNF